MRIVLVATRVHAGGRDQPEIHRDTRQDSDLAEGFEQVPRDEWHARAGLDLDYPFAPLTFVVAAIAFAVECLGTLKRRIEKRIVNGESDTTELRVGTHLQALPPRAAEIAEVAEAGLLRHHKQNV